MIDLPRSAASSTVHPPPGAVRSWESTSSERRRRERRTTGPSGTSAWQQLATSDGPIGGVVELSRSFADTDDGLVECMTCGVVGPVSGLRVRTVHHLTDEDAGGRGSTRVSFACRVCSSRGTVVLIADPTVPVRESS